MEASQKVKQQRSICEFLFCLKMKPRRAQRRSFELSLASELCPNPRSFRLLNAPRAFRCSVPQDSIWEGPRGGRPVLFGVVSLGIRQMSGNEDSTRLFY